ncbi:MAG: zinc-binding dehydrogenase [Acidimicrobiia bacterium]|nr:zinc-binding dehydrogenase [Acidimicrobiia bacterium]
MRTWRVHELGEPTESMRLEEGPPPEVRPGGVVLDVEAVGLNFPDLLQVRGGYQVKPELPFTPGGEIAGVVSAVGEGVDVGRLGERVLMMGTAGLADQAAGPADKAFTLPDSMPFEKAAALLSNYGTTWFALHERARLQPGEVLLVHAAAGGIGSAAVQLGKAAGAMVIGTAGGPAKKATVAGLGADVAIDYLAEDFVEATKAATDGRGADVVYDPVGGDTFDRSRRAIAWDGRLLVIGFTSGRIPEVPANHVLLKNYSVVGVHWGASLGRDPSSLRRTYDALCAEWDKGTIDPLVGDVLPLDGAAKGLERLGSRASVGKLVVRPTA